MGRPREFSDQAVLDAAMELFWEKGYEATSTQELCARTGLGRGSLYNAFGSKHRLYREAIRRYAETSADSQLAMLGDESLPVKERLRRMLLVAVEADLADPGRRGCLAVNAATEASGRSAEVAALVARQFAELEEVLCHLVMVGQSSGELSSARPPRQVARAFQSTYCGLRVLAKVAEDRKALEDVVEGAIAAL